MGAESETFGTLDADKKPSEDEPDVPEVLPPETVLDTPNPDLLKGLIPCLKSVEEVREYVAYENRHKQRDVPLRMLSERADQLRD